jgi:hypothetical protein
MLYYLRRALFYDPQITHQQNALYFHFILQPLHIIADKNIGCEGKVVYEPPEDGHIKAETYVRVAE